MKLTREKLKSIVKEELKFILKENSGTREILIDSATRNGVNVTIITCPKCRGLGTETIQTDLGYGDFRPDEVVACPFCDGKRKMKRATFTQIIVDDQLEIVLNRNPKIKQFVDSKDQSYKNELIKKLIKSYQAWYNDNNRGDGAESSFLADLRNEMEEDELLG